MMRLRALRLAEFKRFGKPVALEGFGDGLNVLTGPNEFGKSTLFDALDAALRISFNSRASQVDALQSNSGGAPRVEVDFEADGRLWRLNKQFLSGRSASLLDVASGALLRNADAEARLAVLKAGALNFDRFGLLWVRQGTLDHPRDSEGGVAALLGSEVDAVALDARARAVHARVLKALLELQTEKTQKPRGTWQACLKAREEAAKRLEAAEGNARRQADRLAELARVADERDRLMAPDAVAGRHDALALAKKRHGEADAARRQKALAEKDLKAAQEAVQRAERERKVLAAELAAWERLNQQRSSELDTGSTLQARRNEADTALKAAATVAQQDRELLARLEMEMAEASDAREANQAAIERDRLAAQIGELRSVIADAEAALQAIASLRAVTPQRVKELEAAIQDLQRIDAAFAAVVPHVTIALEPAASGRVHVGGQPVAGAAEFNPTEPLTIDIAGIGRITIAPNPATVSATQRSAHERLRAEIETTYAALGVATLADAQSRLAERQLAEAKVREADIRAKALAPQGLDALTAAHSAISVRAASTVAGFDPSAVEATRKAFEAQKLVVTQSDTKLTHAKQAANDVEVEAAKHETADKSRLQQLQDLEQKLGGPEARQKALSDVEERLASAQKAFTDSKMASDAWTAAPDDVEALAAALDRAQRAVRAADERRAALDVHIGGIEGELRAASEEDVETELDKARADAASAAHRLADVEADVSALNLLDREFQSVADAGRKELSGPILKRITPYLARLFPDAALEFDEVLAPVRLNRNGSAEAHGQLSDGTKEQIAIMVRLGLAQFLADKGAAIPLILDDALVYSDDVRITEMFKMLQDASRRHQVIVLNCREQTFAPLAKSSGTTVLTLKPWVQSALAA